MCCPCGPIPILQAAQLVPASVLRGLGRIGVFLALQPSRDLPSGLHRERPGPENAGAWKKATVKEGSRMLIVPRLFPRSNLGKPKRALGCSGWRAETHHRSGHREGRRRLLGSWDDATLGSRRSKGCRRPSAGECSSGLGGAIPAARGIALCPAEGWPPADRIWMRPSEPFSIGQAITFTRHGLTARCASTELVFYEHINAT